MVPLVDWPGGRHPGIKFDFPESALIAGDILSQYRRQRFGLLRTQIDPLKVADVDLVFAVLLQRAEGEKEIPDADSHLHTVGVILAIFGRVDQIDLRLGRSRHDVSSVAGGETNRQSEA